MQHAIEVSGLRKKASRCEPGARRPWWRRCAAFRSFGPKWQQTLAHLNPLYYVVEASRLLADGVIWDGKVLLVFAVIGALLAIALAWATNVYKKAVV